MPSKLVVSLGFGIDSHHGICHAHVLENIAALQREGAFLGAFSIPPRSAEAAAYRDAVAHARRDTPQTSSIVNGQVAAAVRGDFGDVHTPARTEGTELFVNPLMAMYFTFDLDGLAAHVHYLPTGWSTPGPGPRSRWRSRSTATASTADGPGARSRTDYVSCPVTRPVPPRHASDSTASRPAGSYSMRCPSP